MKKQILLLLCFALATASFSQTAKRHFLLRDEGISQLAYID